MFLTLLFVTVLLLPGLVGREGGPTLPPPIMLTSVEESLSRRSSNSSFSRQSSGAGELVSPRPPLPPGIQQKLQQPEQAGGATSDSSGRRQVQPGVQHQQLSAVCSAQQGALWGSTPQ